MAIDHSSIYSTPGPVQMTFSADSLWLDGEVIAGTGLVDSLSALRFRRSPAHPLQKPKKSQYGPGLL
jgi:hypothetical protein